MSYIHDCSTCKTKCDGKSKGVYNFKNDAEYSEFFENQIIREIINFGLFAQKTEKDGYPDIEVYEYKGGPLRCYIEVKAQRRTFMSVERILPLSKLKPSETMALNLSDLVRYFDIAKKEPVPVYILWVLSERPCIIGNHKHLYFYQNTDVLQSIYQKAGMTRRFRRESGYGDVVNGVHKGVVINYHFSLNELKPFDLKDI